MSKTYKISEISAITGFSVSTLHYYEEIGLINPARNESNYRIFTDADLTWLEFLQRAKATGMPLEKIKEFSDLRAQGDDTMIQRISLLVEQEKISAEKIKELEEHIRFIRGKKRHYYELLEQRNKKI